MRTYTPDLKLKGGAEGACTFATLMFLVEMGIAVFVYTSQASRAPRRMPSCTRKRTRGRVFTNLDRSRATPTLATLAILITHSTPCHLAAAQLCSAP